VLALLGGNLPEAEADVLAGGQRTGGTPAGENHSRGHWNGMSSWFPNTVAHGTPLLLAGEIALSQYRLALGIGRLFAVTTSPRYTTKSGEEGNKKVNFADTMRVDRRRWRVRNEQGEAGIGPGVSASRTVAMTPSEAASCAGPQSVHAFSP
jgi:hypothetical protein